MKHLSLSLFLVLILSASTAGAQTLVSRGVIGGATFAEHLYDGDNPWEQNPDGSVGYRSGFHLGGYVEWFDVPYISLVIPVMYNEKGTEIEIPRYSEVGPPEIEGVDTFDSRLAYLTIGAYGKVSLPVVGQSLYTLVGPRFDILLNYDERALLSGTHDDFKTIVVGGTVGGGIEMNLLTGVTTCVELRYNIDFTDSWDEPVMTAPPSSTTYTIKNRSIDISLGFGI